VPPQTVIGTQIGDYKVLKEIGEEAMGMVYLGEHHLLKQKVAIKALKAELLRSDMKERFEREALVMARLNHPNITRLLNFYNLPTGCFIVMEHAEGETLEVRLQKEGPIPIPQAVTWMIQVLRGLGSAHAQGIVHRDIQPANILITTANIAKLRDFGMAKADDAPQLTMTGLTLGTVSYMSREQLVGKSLDQRSDVYSLGVTLFEITTGKLPFADEEEKKLVLKIMKQDPTPPSAYVPGYPKELEKIILKSLAKERAQRFATAEDMALTLEKFLASASATAGADTAAASAQAGIETVDVGASGGITLPPPPPPPPPRPAPPPPPPPPTTATPPVAAPAPNYGVSTTSNVLPPAQPAGATAPSAAAPPLLSGMVITGICFIAGSVGLGTTLILALPNLKILAAAVFGMGLPIGFVLVLVGFLRASAVGNPPR
jgi:serine/threonine-protein kinase